MTRHAAYGVERRPPSIIVGTPRPHNAPSGVCVNNISPRTCNPAARLAMTHNHSNIGKPHHAPRTANTLTSAAPMTRIAKSGKKLTKPTSVPINACSIEIPNGFAFISELTSAAIPPQMTSEFRTSRNRISPAATRAAQARKMLVLMRCAISRSTAHAHVTASEPQPRLARPQRTARVRAANWQSWRTEPRSSCRWSSRW